MSRWPTWRAIRTGCWRGCGPRRPPPGTGPGHLAVTGYDLAVAVLRDARTFTVDVPGFSTAQVVGPSMRSLDGAPHAHHRGPFNRPFRHDEVHARLAAFTRADTGRLVSAIEPLGAAGLRRAWPGRSRPGSWPRSSVSARSTRRRS